MRTRGRDRAMLLALAPTVVVLFFVSLSGVLLSDDPTRHAGIGDTYAYHGPAQFFLDTSLRDGDLPLWNPHTYSGMPFAAHPLSMAFYPPNLVRSMFAAATTPRDTLVSLYGLALFHLLALAFGMYGLARREGLRSDTSFVVAVAVPLSSQWLVFSVTNIALICGTSWMPLILLCLNRAVAEEQPRRRASWFVVGGLVYGLQILAGFFQAAIYVSFVYVLYVTVPAAIRLRRHPRAVIARELTARLSGLALFGATGTLLAAAIVMPSVELMGASARAAVNYQAYQAGQGSVNLSTWAWIGMLLERVGPGFIAARSAVAAAAVWILSLNLGLLIAAAAAAFSDRRRTVVVYAAASYVLVDLVMGSPMPLASLVDAILPFETSSPFYSSVSCSVPLGILAGFGLEALFTRERARAKPGRQAWVLAGVGLFLIGALDDPALTRLDSGVLRFLLPGTVLVLLVVAAFRGGRGLRPALLGVLLVEAAVAGPAIVKDAFHQPFQYPGTAEPLDQEPRGIQDARVFANHGNLHLWSLRSAMDGYEPLLLNWTIPLLSNPGEETSYRRTVRMRQNRSAASLLRRRFWLVPAVVEGELPPKTRLFPPTGAVFLADASEMALPRVQLSDLPRSAIGAPGEEIVLWKAGESGARRQRAPIRIGPVALGRKSSSLFIDYRASQAVRISVSITGEGAGEDFAFGTGNGLELRPADHTIEVPLPTFERATIEIRRVSGRGPKGLAIERVRKVVDAKDESNLVRIEELTPDRVRVALRGLPGPRALVFTDAHYPGWTATLDRAPVPIHLANGAFKAVLVPEGSHEVEFTFSQSRVRLGVAVSVLTLAAAAGFVGREWWRSRRAHSM